MKGYHVHYSRHDKEAERRGEPRVTRETTILLEVHPLVWANYPPRVYREHFWTEITGWQEFDCPPTLRDLLLAGEVLDFQTLDGTIKMQQEAGNEAAVKRLIAYRKSLRRRAAT